jgi:hypothetical protein
MSWDPEKVRRRAEQSRREDRERERVQREEASLEYQQQQAWDAKWRYQEQQAEERKRQAEQERQKKSDAWYSRECPSCSEMVKRKAQLCKECGFEFDDWEQHRKEIADWEQRGAKVGVDPWLEDKINKVEEDAVYWASPEGQAEKQRKAKEKEAEERRAEEVKEAEKVAEKVAEEDRQRRWEVKQKKEGKVIGAIAAFCAFLILFVPYTGEPDREIVVRYLNILLIPLFLFLFPIVWPMMEKKPKDDFK